MSVLQYSSPPSRGRPLETLAIAIGLCLPVPALAATGLSVPLPNVVERLAAALVPWASADAAPGTSGSIVQTAAETEQGRRAAMPQAARSQPAAPGASTRAQKLVAKPGARPAATGGSRPAAPNQTPTGSTPTSAPAGPTAPVASQPAPRQDPAPSPSPTPTDATRPSDTSTPAPKPAPAPKDEPAPTQTNPLAPVTEPVQTAVDDTVTAVEETVTTVEKIVPLPLPLPPPPTAPKLPGLGG